MLNQDLERLLRAYRPADAADERHHRALLELALSPGDCFSRARYDPGHVTASAFVLDPCRARVALIFHKKLERWLQPGGHVEASDPDLLSAAAREVAEETGLAPLAPLGDGLFDVDVHAIPARADEPSHAHFDLRFVFVSRTEEASASDEVAGFRWVPVDEVSSLETDESVLRAVRKLGAMR